MFDPRVEHSRGEYLDLLDDTKATTPFASAARVLLEGALPDEQGRLGFTGFDGRVVRVIIVDADGGVHAIFAELRSPGAAGSEVGMVPGDNALGAGRRQGLEDRIHHCLRDGHPPAQRRRLRGTDDATWREHDRERSKGALVDRQEQRGSEALKGDLTDRATSGGARVEIARDLSTNATEIERDRIAILLPR